MEAGFMKRTFASFALLLAVAVFVSGDSGLFRMAALNPGRYTVSIELTGFTDAMRDRLRAYGLFHEIISWKLRMFVPNDTSGSAILAKVMERYPLSRIADRTAT
jgi:hypothetical protein